MRTGNVKKTLLIILFTFCRILPAPPAADRATTQAGTVPTLNDGGQHAQEEEGKDKDMMQMLMAAMQAAQAAAAIAAAASNKKGAEKAKASDPVKVPEIPGASVPPTASTAPQEQAKLPEAPASTPIPEIEVPVPSSAAVAQDFSFPSPSPAAESTIPPVVAEGPQSEIPDTIPYDRAKIGYDERNPTGGPANASANGYTPTSTTGGPGSSAGGRGVNASDESNGKKERWAKNVTSNEDGDGGPGVSGGYGSGSGGSEEGEKKDSGNVMDMLNQMMGKGPEDGAALVGIHTPGEGFQNGAAGAKAAGPQRETIFEYASFRYRKLAFEERNIKRDARKKPAIAGVLGDAHEIFSSAAH